MSIRAQVLNLLRHLQKERGITYLFIAHDLSVMRYISDRIAVIHKGDIVELADAEELVTHAIHPYTRSLLSAIPMPNPRLERKKKLLVYDPAMHDYTQEAPQWRELRPATGCSAASRRPKTGWLKCKLSLAFFDKVRPLFLDISTLLYYNSSCTYCVVFNKRTKFKTPLNLAAPAAGAVTAQRTRTIYDNINTPIYASQARPWLKFYDQKYIDQTMPACTAFELVCRQNKNRLGETALEYYGRKFTYADFIVQRQKDSCRPCGAAGP